MIKKYKERKELIKGRLKEFRKVRGDEIFYEMIFCLLTPQSSAKLCDEAVQNLKKKDFLHRKLNPVGMIKGKARFHNNKARYLVEVKNNFNEIKKKIKETKNGRELREWLVKNVKGFGLKESSHFLRNIGYRNLAILDRHVLKELEKEGVIEKTPDILSNNLYLKIEEQFKEYAREKRIPIDELDLLLWSIETGEVFK